MLREFSQFVIVLRIYVMSQALKCISVVTINHNNAKGLKRTLESVTAQRAYLPDAVTLEHIIVDGNSTDESLAWINSDIESKVIIVPAKGVYNAANVGLRQASGDIVGLLHAGDIYTTDEALSIIAGCFESDSCLDFTWGDVTIGHRYYRGKNFSVKGLTTGFAPPHPSLYIRRALLDTVGYYDETYENAADFDYFVRIALQSSLKGIYIPGAMVVMEPGGKSQTLRSRLFINNRERLTALRRHGLKTSHLKLLVNYKNVLAGYLCSHKKVEHGLFV